MREIDPETKRRAFYRGLEYEIHMPGIIVEIVTDETWLDDVIAKIVSADNGSVTAGRDLQVFPIEESYRIHDGFMDI